jgi:hypothetical protein
MYDYKTYLLIIKRAKRQDKKAFKTIARAYIKFLISFHASNIYKI